MIKRNFEPGLPHRAAPEGPEPRAAGRARARRQPAATPRRARSCSTPAPPHGGAAWDHSAHGARARVTGPPRNRPGLKRRPDALPVADEASAHDGSGSCCGDCSTPRSPRARRQSVAANLPPPPRGRTLVLGAGKAGGVDGRARWRRYWPPTRRCPAWSSRATATCRRAVRRPASRWSRPRIRCPTTPGRGPRERILELAQGLTPDDLVLCLISGGGSALLALPRRRPDAGGQAGHQPARCCRAAPASTR